MNHSKPIGLAGGQRVVVKFCQILASGKSNRPFTDKITDTRLPQRVKPLIIQHFIALAKVAPRLPEGSHVASAHGNRCLVIPRVASRRLKMLQLNWIHCSAKSAFEAALISHFKPTAICFSACQFSF